MASCCSRWIRLSPEGDGSSGRLGMGRGPVVLPVRIGTCLWLLGRQLCLRSHHDGADGNPSLYRGLAAFAHRKPAPAGSASQFRQFALVHRVKMSSRNARFRDQHSARKMTEFRALCGPAAVAGSGLAACGPEAERQLLYLGADQADSDCCPYRKPVH